MRSPDFLPNLRMVDATGEEYPLMSNVHLRTLLEAAATAGPNRDKAAGILADVDSRKTYLLWFRVPPRKVFAQNEVRVLHVRYEYAKEKGGWLDRMRDRLARTVVIKVPSAQPFPVFWVLEKPPGYNISRRRYSRVGPAKAPSSSSWEDSGGAVFAKDTPKSVSLYVKPALSNSILSYSVTPKKTVLALPMSVITMLSLLAVSMGASPLVDGDSPLWPVAESIMRHEMLLFLFITTSSLVVPRFIDDSHIRNSLLWMYFVPVGLALLFFIL